MLGDVYDVGKGARNESRREAAGRHAFARYFILRAAEDALNDLLQSEGSLAPLRLTSIDMTALAVWDVMWQPRNPAGYGGWDWRAIHANYSRRTARLDVALWSGSELCGLALGRISDGRAVVRVDWMEGKPGAHALKGRVAPFMADIAAVFADAYKSSAIRFQRPLRGVIKVYEAIGFQYVKGRPDYCERPVP